jgi:hypothetical protein
MPDTPPACAHCHASIGTVQTTPAEAVFCSDRCRHAAQVRDRLALPTDVMPDATPTELHYLARLRDRSPELSWPELTNRVRATRGQE